MKYPNLIKSLQAIANELDSKGNTKYADVIDAAIKVIAADEPLWFEKLTPEERKLDEIGSYYSDLFKEIYGHRPRTGYETVEEYEVAIKDLLDIRDNNRG